MTSEPDDDVRVFRFVKRDDIVRQEDETVRPKSSAFSDHRSDGAMSVFLENEILDGGRSPEELLQLWGEEYVVCYHTVREYRELGQVIAPAAIDEFPGHANVTDGAGKRSAGRKTKLAKSARWLTAEEQTSSDTDGSAL